MVASALPAQRRRAIAAYVRRNRWVTIGQLCELTQSSSSTVRRDLVELKRCKVLDRVHGGAVSTGKWHSDAGVLELDDQRTSPTGDRSGRARDA